MHRRANEVNELTGLLQPAAHLGPKSGQVDQAAPLLRDASSTHQKWYRADEGEHLQPKLQVTREPAAHSVRALQTAPRPAERNDRHAQKPACSAAEERLPSGKMISRPDRG